MARDASNSVACLELGQPIGWELGGVTGVVLSTEPQRSAIEADVCGAAPGSGGGRPGESKRVVDQAAISHEPDVVK